MDSLNFLTDHWSELIIATVLILTAIIILKMLSAKSQLFSTPTAKERSIVAPIYNTYLTSHGDKTDEIYYLNKSIVEN